MEGGLSLCCPIARQRCKLLAEVKYAVAPLALLHATSMHGGSPWRPHTLPCPRCDPAALPHLELLDAGIDHAVHHLHTLLAAAAAALQVGLVLGAAAGGRGAVPEAHR